MPNATYNIFKHQVGLAQVDFSTGDFRVALLMSNTTAEADIDADTVGAIGTLDEFDGTGYTAGVGTALTGISFNLDDVNDLAFFDADDTAYTGLGPGSRQIVGALLLEFAVSFGASMPIAYIEFPSPITPGGDLTIQWATGGILQHT